MCRIVKRSYFIFHGIMKREQIGTLQNHPHRRRERERRGGNGYEGGLHKDGNLNCHSSSHLYLSILTLLGKTCPQSLFLCSFLLIHLPPVYRGAFEARFITKKHISEHQNFVLHRSKRTTLQFGAILLAQTRGCLLCIPSQVTRLCAKRTLSK